MTIRAVLAAVATAIALGGFATPARAGGALDPVFDVVREVGSTAFQGDWCVAVDDQPIVCPPWGSLPVDPRTILPPPQ